MERSCNYAFLVAMDREILKRQASSGGGGGGGSGGGAAGGATLDPSGVTFSKEELMRLANDGKLCEVDVYDGHAVAATQASGSYGYDGWANVQKGLIKRDVPWLPLLLEHRNKRAVGGGASFSLSDPAGVAAARRLHMEAELCGHCSCGPVLRSNLMSLMSS